ncbi:MotA/TolQ/ExbB proton channel family protein [Alkanindiges illinoisensis]|uniref:MotA/TolQ/ExbB proton channel family protein n=1 Tax=Alkanindiges illinoisensis TaxID=197183 RepID=UPI00047DE2B0|nr:MotA/TolQ/ExbB proton channel family protein [Alkanindiges illinoisensis]
MWEMVKAGGWLMLPLVICSIAMCAIIIERAIRLRIQTIAPAGLTSQISKQLRAGSINAQALRQLRQQSVLGDILATGIESQPHGFNFTENQMQTRANELVHLLEKNLNFLGTIGAIAPLLGLLGTVIGIIESFMAVNAGGVTDPAMLAAGISQALITTAAGMVVAIPALIAYRYFQRKIVDISMQLETQGNQLINILFYSDVKPSHLSVDDHLQHPDQGLHYEAS